MPVPVPTPDEVGWGTQSVRCPAQYVDPAYAVTCTAYGQGGSMVTDPIGINHAAGPMTVPRPKLEAISESACVRSARGVRDAT